MEPPDGQKPRSACEMAGLYRSRPARASMLRPGPGSERHAIWHRPEGGFSGKLAPYRSGMSMPTGQKTQGRKIVSARGITAAALASIAVAAMAIPALAADVTAQRLLNTADEPQNWLIVHHDYNNSRHSPLKDVNRDTVK